MITTTYMPRLFAPRRMRAALWFVWMWPGSLTRESNGRWRTHGVRGRRRPRWRFTMAIAQLLAFIVPRALTPGRWGGVCRTRAAVWLWGALGAMAGWVKPSRLGRTSGRVKRRLAIGGVAAMFMGVAAVAATGMLTGGKDSANPSAGLAEFRAAGPAGAQAGSGGGGDVSEGGGQAPADSAQGGGSAAGGSGEAGARGDGEAASNDSDSIELALNSFSDGEPFGGGGPGDVAGDTTAPSSDPQGPEGPDGPSTDDGLTVLDPPAEGGLPGLGGGAGGGGGGGFAGGGAGGGGGGGSGGGNPGDPFAPPGPGQDPPGQPFNPPVIPQDPLGPPGGGPGGPSPPTDPFAPGGGFQPEPPGGGPSDPGSAPGGPITLLPPDLPGDDTHLAVPEPGAWLLMILGFGALGAQLRRARRAQLA